MYHIGKNRINYIDFSLWKESLKHDGQQFRQYELPLNSEQKSMAFAVNLDP